ncbi:hypothetical protein BHE74_00018655 [Ensete ventricosum]|nr:hypothetical protein BHE74_00018655 [Ensete ventricosum]
MKVSQLNKILDLVFQVVTLFCVMSVFSMEMIVPSLVVSFGPCPDRVGGPEEPSISDLEEDFCPTVGLGRELAKNLSSNSLASESKEEMDDGPSRLYHIRAGPLRVVESHVYNILGMAHRSYSEGVRVWQRFFSCGGVVVSRCWVALLGLTAIGTFLAGAPVEGPVARVPLATRVEE